MNNEKKTKKDIENSKDEKDNSQIDILKTENNLNKNSFLTYNNFMITFLSLIFFSFLGILISSLFYTRYITIYDREPFTPFNCIRFLYKNPKDKENQEIPIICAKYIEE